MTAQEARLDLYALAALLDRSYDYIVRHWRRMCDDEGMPRPYIGQNGRKPRWSRKAIEAWRDGDHVAREPAVVDAPERAAAVANDPVPAPTRLGGVAALLKAAGG